MNALSSMISSPSGKTRIGLIAHVEKKGAATAVQKVVQELERHHLPFCIEKTTAELINYTSGLDGAMLAEQSDILLVMGGDGSILRALHLSSAYLRPIFGLNIGSLGFLTCLAAQDYQRAVQCLADKTYILSDRNLLEIEIHGTDKAPEQAGIALNDLVISRGNRSQLVRLSVAIDGDLLTEYHADGLIVATPTGSTAYSLAAGGPIVMPESKALIITPICPHVFSNRSIVLSDQSLIAITAASDQEIFMSIDGRKPRLIKSQEQLIIRTSSKKLPLAMLPETTFAEILRQKLQWTGSNITPL